MATPVAAVAAACGLSARQLRRRFHRAVGLTPKELGRVQRLRWTCIESLRPGAPPWAELAFLSGFADQAHLVREVGGVTGLSPRSLRTHLGRIEHSHLGP